MLKENLISLRKLRAVSQEEVAFAAGVSRQAYAKWEKGEALPDIERCRALSEYYGITIDALIENPKEFSGRPLAPAPKGKHIFGMVTVNDRGQVVVPQKARELFSLKSGSRLVVLADEEEGLALIPAESFEQKMELINRLKSLENPM